MTAQPFDRTDTSAAGAPNLHVVGDAADLTLVPLGGDLHSWVAEQHVRELPHGLFPRLGRRFVGRWHRAHVASPYGVGFVAVRGGELVGFAIGSTDRKANVAWLLAHRRGNLVVAAGVAMMLRPALAVEFLRTRATRYARRFLRRPTSSSPTDPDLTVDAVTVEPTRSSIAVLEAVVVVPHARGKGVGSRLVRDFVDSAARSGATRAELVTKDGTRGAAGFYTKGGWHQKDRHVDRDGDVVLTFATDLAPVRPA